MPKTKSETLNLDPSGWGSYSGSDIDPMREASKMKIYGDLNGKPVIELQNSRGEYVTLNGSALDDVFKKLRSIL